MSNYCVFYHSKQIHKYFIYYSVGKYQETDVKPSDIDCFEHSRLTQISIKEQLSSGITLEKTLKDYCQNIQGWRDEIKSCKKMTKKFDFFSASKKRDGTKFINTNESNIMRFFYNYSSKIYTNDKFDKITWYEYTRYELCYNAALMRCFNTGIIDCIGYDFNKFYPTILASKLVVNGTKQPFYFPTKEGHSMKFDKLDFNNVAYGLYDCIITATNPDFSKIFDFNNNNVYTHYDLQFANQHKERFGVTIQLITNSMCNALIYHKNHLLDGHHVFSFWFDRIIDLKTEFPKNGLIKLLSSSIWGYLSKINRRYYNDKELDEHPEIIFDYDDNETITHLCHNELDVKHDSTTNYLLVDKSNPYSKNYRLKPFIQAFCRSIIGNIAIDIGLHKVVRINTDNITFNKNVMTDTDLAKLESISPQFILEEKTTGKFDIKHINKFERV